MFRNRTTGTCFYNTRAHATRTHPHGLPGVKENEKQKMEQHPVLTFAGTESILASSSEPSAIVLMIEDKSSKYPVTLVVKCVTVSAVGAPDRGDLRVPVVQKPTRFMYPQPMQDLSEDGCVMYRIEFKTESVYPKTNIVYRVIVEHESEVNGGMASNAIMGPAASPINVVVRYLNFDYSGTYTDGDGNRKLFLAFDENDIDIRRFRLTVADSFDLTAESFSELVSFDDERTIGSRKVAVVADLPVVQDLTVAQPMVVSKCLVRLVGEAAVGPTDFLMSTEDYIRMPLIRPLVQCPACSDFTNDAAGVTFRIQPSDFPEFHAPARIVVHVGNQIGTYYDQLLRARSSWVVPGSDPGRNFVASEFYSSFTAMIMANDDIRDYYADSTVLQNRCLMDAIFFETNGGGNPTHKYWTCRPSILPTLSTRILDRFSAYIRDDNPRVQQLTMAEMVEQTPGEAHEFTTIDYTAPITISGSFPRYVRVAVQTFDANGNASTPETYLVGRPNKPASVAVNAVEWAAARFIIAPYLPEDGDEYSGPDLEFVVEILVVDEWFSLPTTPTRDNTTHIHTADLSTYTGAVVTRVRGVIGEDEVSDELLDVPPFERPYIKWVEGEGVSGVVEFVNFPALKSLDPDAPDGLIVEATYYSPYAGTMFTVPVGVYDGTLADILHHDMLTHLIVGGVEFPVAAITGTATPPRLPDAQITITNGGRCALVEDPWMSTAQGEIKRTVYYAAASPADVQVSEDTFTFILDALAPDGVWVYEFGLPMEAMANKIVFTYTVTMSYVTNDGSAGGLTTSVETIHEHTIAQATGLVATLEATKITFALDGNVRGARLVYENPWMNGQTVTVVHEGEPVFGTYEFWPYLHHLIAIFDDAYLTIPRSAILISQPFVLPVDHQPNITLSASGNQVNIQSRVPPFGSQTFTLSDHDDESTVNIVQVTFPLVWELPAGVSSATVVDGLASIVYTSPFGTSDLVVAALFTIWDSNMATIWKSVAVESVTWPSVSLPVDENPIV